MRRNRERVFVVGLAVALSAAWSSAVLAQGKDDKKLRDNQRKAALVLVKAVDSAMLANVPAGPSFWMAKPDGKESPVAGTDSIKMSWHNDMMRAGDGKSYLPFTVFVEPGKLPSGPVAVLLRVAPKGSAPIETKEKDKSPYPWEDFYFTDLQNGPGGQLMLTRVFQLGAGSYDAWVAMRPLAQNDKSKDMVPVAVYKKELEVADIATAGLTTSSILVVGKVEQLSAPPTPDQQRERPYIMGGVELVPVLDPKLKKTDEFTTYFQIYNAQLTEKKPDLTVEYNFYRKDAGNEKYFNKTNPQKFSAQTLPAGWDPDAGHVISAGQSIPLASFPEGDYRLEIKIIDNTASKTITRDVLFSVSP